jgi:hypothetical protein
MPGFIDEYGGAFTPAWASSAFKTLCAAHIERLYAPLCAAPSREPCSRMLGLALGRM